MHLGLSLSLTGQQGGGGGSALFSQVQSLFNGGAVAGAQYDLSRLSGVWQDRARTTPASVNGVVGAYDDWSGNGNHQIAASDSQRGILRQSGALYYLEPDGVDDQYNAASYSGSADFTEVHALRFTKAPAAVTDSVAAVQCALYRGSTVPLDNPGKFVLVAGGSPATVNESTSDIVLLAKRASGTGTIQINNGTAATAAMGANNRSGLRMMDLRATVSTSYRFAGRYYGGIVINDLIDEDLVKMWCASLGGVTL